MGSLQQMYCSEIRIVLIFVHWIGFNAVLIYTNRFYCSSYLCEVLIWWYMKLTEAWIGLQSFCGRHFGVFWNFIKSLFRINSKLARQVFTWLNADYNLMHHLASLCHTPSIHSVFAHSMAPSIALTSAVMVLAWYWHWNFFRNVNQHLKL